MSSKKTTVKIRIAARQDDAKAELREQILIAARDLVVRHGFASLSIRKLAESIGYAPGTIYLYFKDRDDLVREICVRGLVQLSAQVQSAAKHVDPATRLTALLSTYADFAIRNPETYRLTLMENPAFAREVLRTAPLESEDGAGRQAFALIVKTLSELQQNGKLAQNEDPNLLGEMMWTAVHGIVSLKLVHPAFPVNSVETLIDKLIETVLAAGAR